MATLVLTTVGAAIGGPVGAAIGAAVGQYVDRDVLFAPKGRTGPRLTELAVQTSSYGTPIPKLFGTLRVAGTVIWSTDLIESRSSSRAGKGQPTVTTYSYSASFAVLLSARPIVDVRRIWAEGKLLRGAAGDFKVQTGFRLHLGDEDQAADPLIAAAEGDQAPAHRGGAYAVFENLQLADYGNRIPSLTFEVVADPDDVSVGAIAAALAPEIAADAALPLGGFAASGDSVAGVLSTLTDMSGARIADAAGVLTLRDAPAAVSEVADDGFATRGAGAISQWARTAADSVPRTLAVSYYDPARDYQAALQRAVRPGPGVRDATLEAPAALDAGAAKAIAAAALRRAEAARETRTLALGFAGLALAPGDGVTIAGEAGGWVVRETSIEAMVTGVTLDATDGGALPTTATSGSARLAADDIVGATVLCAAELPVLDDSLAAAPQVTILATGEGAGWRRAALLYSLDAGQSWQPAGSTAAPAVIGTVDMLPAASPATLIDRVDAVTVKLARQDDVLSDADDGQLDAGANLALVGDELLQFGRAEPLGNGSWRLSALWRGRRGTKAAIGGQAAGARFALIDRDAVTVLPLPASTIGGSVAIMATGVGDGDTPVVRQVPITGLSVAPPSPVGLVLDRGPDGSGVLRWTRRSRAGWRWIDGVDAPLAEESERYRVTLAATAASRTTDCAEPMLALSADDLAGVTAISVCQLGTLAASVAATITIRGDDHG